MLMELPGCCLSLMLGSDSSKWSEAMSLRSAASVAIVALISAAILAGCGGGGGGGDDTPPTGNRAPVISSLTADQQSLWPTANAQLTVSASDADNDTLTYTWSATGGTLSGTGNTRTWNAPLEAGTYTVSVTVSDGRGGQDQDSIVLTVLDIGPHPPPPY